jgi:hypothetical protein
MKVGLWVVSLAQMKAARKVDMMAEHWAMSWALNLVESLAGHWVEYLATRMAVKREHYLADN